MRFAAPFTGQDSRALYSSIVGSPIESEWRGSYAGVLEPPYFEVTGSLSVYLQSTCLIGKGLKELDHE